MVVPLSGELFLLGWGVGHIAWARSMHGCVCGCGCGRGGSGCACGGVCVGRSPAGGVISATLHGHVVRVVAFVVVAQSR